MSIPYEKLRQVMLSVGLTQNAGEPYTYYYPTPNGELVFTPEPDPDESIDVQFVLDQIGLWDVDLAVAIQRKLRGDTNAS